MTASNDWHKKRKYLHFDSPLSQHKASLLVKSPKNVSQHSFFPLISFDVNTHKYNKDKATGELCRSIKPRHISYAAHSDSHIYSYYSKLLSEKYEKQLKESNLTDCVLAFRRFNEKMSNIEFAKIAFDEIKKRASCAAVCFDVTNFFGELNHKILKKMWSDLLGEATLPSDHYNVYKNITRYAEVDKIGLYNLLSISPSNPKKDRFRVCSIEEFRTVLRPSGIIKSNNDNKGIPQGSSISALLSNIYMLDFDRFAKEQIDSVGGHYFRYCDDILCVVPVSEKENIKTLLSSKIDEYLLELHPNKTVTRVFTKDETGALNSDKPLQYLGFLFDGQKVLLRNAALARYSERMKASVHLYGNTKLKRDKLRLEKGLPPTDFYKKKLYKKYGYVGRRNFVRYGYRAANIMESNAIKKQLRPLWKRLNERIEIEQDKIGNILFEIANNKK
jgi:hypothetical protein